MGSRKGPCAPNLLMSGSLLDADLKTHFSVASSIKATIVRGHTLIKSQVSPSPSTTAVADEMSQPTLRRVGFTAQAEPLTAAHGTCNPQAATTHPTQLVACRSPNAAIFSQKHREADGELRRRGQTALRQKTRGLFLASSPAPLFMRTHPLAGETFGGARH